MTTSANASRTNQVTVWVTDTGNTNLADAMTFTVVVGECVVPGLGRQVLLAGDGGKVPVNLISSVPLTNLSMTVFAPMDRLTNLSLEPIVPEVCDATLMPLFQGSSSGRESVPSAREEDQSRLTSAATGGGTFDFHLLSLSTCAGQWMIGTQQVAWLHFQAVSNPSSGFVTLSLDDIVGYRIDGTEARNFAPQSGRLVIIGEEPLLEAMYDTNGVPMLMLYGKTDRDYVLEQSPQMGVSAQWTPQPAFTMTNLWQSFTMPPTLQQQFYRARRD